MWEGTGGGGGGVTNEPRLSYQAEAGTSIFDLRFSGAAEAVIFTADGNPLGSNPQGAEQLWALDLSNGDLRQVTDVPVSPMINFPDMAISDNGDRVVWISSLDLVPGMNPNLWPNLFARSTFGGSISQVSSNDWYSKFAIAPQIASPFHHVSPCSLPSPANK